MEIKLDMECIQLINFFESFTGINVRDCIVKNGKVYFIIDKDQGRHAIGRGGKTVYQLERRLGKRVKIIEYSDDVPTFVKNLVPNANVIKVNGTKDNMVVGIKVSKPDRYAVIGRDSKNLNLIKEILQRNSNIRDLIVR